MRTLTYGAACSLDGFIAGPNDEIDWLHFSRDVHRMMADYWKTIDTLLMGRKTYEVAAQQAGGPNFQGMRAYVFSRTLDASPPGAQLVSDDAGEFVRGLKQQPGKGIGVFGGGDFGRSLFEAGVVDEVRLNVHPVLLGSGVPLFRDAGRIALTLGDCRVIDGGCILASYRVAQPSRRQSRRTVTQSDGRSRRKPAAGRRGR